MKIYWEKCHGHLHKWYGDCTCHFKTLSSKGFAKKLRRIVSEKLKWMENLCDVFEWESEAFVYRRD